MWVTVLIASLEGWIRTYSPMSVLLIIHWREPERLENLIIWTSWSRFVNIANWFLWVKMPLWLPSAVILTVMLALVSGYSWGVVGWCFSEPIIFLLSLLYLKQTDRLIEVESGSLCGHSNNLIKPVVLAHLAPCLTNCSKTHSFS